MGQDTLATSLKTALGPGPYRSFRATSHALQLGDVSADTWYSTASRALRDKDLLDAVVRSIPDAGVRSEVERAHRDRVRRAQYEAAAPVGRRVGGVPFGACPGCIWAVCVTL